MAAFYVAAGAFAVLQFFADNPEVTAVLGTVLTDEAALLRRRLSAQRPAWPSGPRLEFDQVLADVAAANAALAALATGTPGGRRRRRKFVASLTWRGAPRTYVRALRLGRALAAFAGDVAVDIETRAAPLRADAAGDAARRRRRSRSGASPCARSEARAAAAAAAEARAAAAGSAGGGADASAATGEDDDDEAFEDVRVVRRATLEQFYSYLLPALQQVAADAAHAQGGAGVAGTRINDGHAAAAAAEGDEAAALCSICYDAPVDTVSPCAHAFCAECYGRWRERSLTCALCRAALPPERGGCGAWVLPDADADVPIAPRVTPAALAAWVHALPPATS